MTWITEIRIRNTPQWKNSYTPPTDEWIPDDESSVSIKETEEDWIEVRDENN